MRTRISSVSCLALVFSLVISTVQTALADDATPMTAEQIAKIYEDVKSHVRSAYVEFNVKSANLLPLDVLAKYDIAAYLVDQSVTFAVGPEKHYFRELNHSGPPGLIMDRVQVWRPEGSIQERRPNPGFNSPNAPTDVPMYYIERPDLSRGARFNCLYFNCICFDYADVTRAETTIDRAQDRSPWRLDTIPRLLRRSGMVVLPGTTKVNGVPCVVAKLENWQTLWFDPALGYALRKRELFEGGKLKYEIIMNDFVESSPGLWIPRTVSYTTHALGEVPSEIQGKLALKHEIKMTRFEINNPKREGLFTMKVEPGALVVDTTTAPVGSAGEIKPAPDGSIPAVTYRQPASEADLDEVVNEARRDVGYWYESRNKNWFKLAIIALATAIIAASTYIWQKQKQKRIELPKTKKFVKE